MRERFFALDVDFFPDVPVESKMVAVEGAHAADGLIERGGGEFSLVLEVNEEIEHPLWRKRGEIFMGKMAAELKNPAIVCLAAVFGKSFELDKPGEVLIPSSRCE